MSVFWEDQCFVFTNELILHGVVEEQQSADLCLSAWNQ